MLLVRGWDGWGRKSASPGRLRVQIAPLAKANRFYGGITRSAITPRDLLMNVWKLHDEAERREPRR